MNAAIYPNAVTSAAAILNRTRADEQDPLAKLMNTWPTSAVTQDRLATQ
jgi:hypothetical protein